jgi:hypothetical protein
MAKIAIIDLDGVVANAQHRFKAADESGFLPKGDTANAYWEIALNPIEMLNDETIPDAGKDLIQIEQLGYSIIFLSSRPQLARSETELWLTMHSLIAERDLILKPNALKWMKTTTWKAGHANLIAKALWQAGSELLIVDDEEANLDAMQDAAAWQRNCRIFQASSLREAIENHEIRVFVEAQHEADRKRIEEAYDHEPKPEDIPF